MEFEELVSAIENGRNEMPASNALLVGISGIDGSGKGFVTGKLAVGVESRGLRCVVLSADAWLNLPDVRFSIEDRARNFYDNAIRLDAMFGQLVLPLKMCRSIELEADLTEETATAFHKHAYTLSDIDIVLLEGIYLFKRKYIANFDLRIWIDCSFETALARAIARSQEGLSPEATFRAYETIYFPAQRLHFTIDEPHNSADIVFPND